MTEKARRGPGPRWGPSRRGAQRILERQEVGGARVSRSEGSSAGGKDLSPRSRLRPPRGREGRKGRCGRTGLVGPPAPPRPPPASPRRVCAARPAPPRPARSRRGRAEPMRPRPEQGQKRAAGGHQQLLPGAPAPPQVRARPPERAPPALPRWDPAPTSEGQRRPQAHAHGPRQRLPRAVDDAAVPQADLEELHPPHAAPWPGGPALAPARRRAPRPARPAHGRPRPPGPVPPLALGPAHPSQPRPQASAPPISPSPAPSPRPRPARPAAGRAGALAGTRRTSAPCCPGSAAGSPAEGPGGGPGRRPLLTLRPGRGGLAGRVHSGRLARPGSPAPRIAARKDVTRGGPVSGRGREAPGGPAGSRRRFLLLAAGAVLALGRGPTGATRPGRRSRECGSPRPRRGVAEPRCRRSAREERRADATGRGVQGSETGRTPTSRSVGRELRGVRLQYPGRARARSVRCLGGGRGARLGEAAAGARGGRQGRPGVGPDSWANGVAFRAGEAWPWYRLL